MPHFLTVPTDNPRAEKVASAVREWNASISDDARRTKYAKMATSPLVFFRGTNHLYWADLAGDWRLNRFGNSATKTWVQGDLHAYNYGSYHNDEGDIVYGLNDFDESLIADYQYDLWRMATSMVLVARQNGDVSQRAQRSIIGSFAESYLDSLASVVANDGGGQTFLTKENAFGKVDDFLEQVEDEYSREGMLDKWAPETSVGRRFDLSRSKLGEVGESERAMIVAAMEAYRETLRNDPADADDYFLVKDIAYRLLAGTGSLGTRRFYVLIEGGRRGEAHDDLILDVKKQRKPSAYQYLSAEEQNAYNRRFDNDAQRHAEGYRALTKHTDDHLGWMQLSDGAYSVRERSPFKEAFPGEKLKTESSFSKLARQWGTVLAFDHARASGKLSFSVPEEVVRLTDGNHKEFRRLVANVALDYADQVAADWGAFTGALCLTTDELAANAFSVPTYHGFLPS